jgi:hypothetical protein
MTGRASEPMIIRTLAAYELSQGFRGCWASPGDPRGGGRSADSATGAAWSGDGGPP